MALRSDQTACTPVYTVTTHLVILLHIQQLTDDLPSDLLHFAHYTCTVAYGSCLEVVKTRLFFSDLCIY